MGARVYIVAVLVQLTFSVQALAIETWTKTHVHKFGFIKTLFRGQGVATDDNGHFWYSGKDSLIRTNSLFGIAQYVHMFPIPPGLHCNHVGAIDYFNGTIYAGVEDGPPSKYAHPHVVLFDAQTLMAKKNFEVPLQWQPDGVPWVAVDAENKFLLSSTFHRAAKINIYDLETLNPLTQIPMSSMVNGVQGAKLFKGSLYMTAYGESDKGFSFYKMNLKDGRVDKVFDFSNDLTEIEGFLIRATDKGAELHVITVVPAFNFLRRLEMVSYVLAEN